jgi:DHA1 family bicyclomycin/chloramphenicol resistance-like MFS transporter
MYGFILLVACYLIVPETLIQKQEIDHTIIKTNITKIMDSRFFIIISLIQGFSYNLLIMFQLFGAFIIENVLHKSSIYFGRFGLILGCCFIVGTFVSRKLLKYFKFITILKGLCYTYIVIVPIGIMLIYLLPNNTIVFLLISMLTFFFTAHIFPLALGEGLALFKEIAGTATAMMYFINVMVVVITSAILSLFDISSVLKLFIVYLSIIFVVTLLYWLIPNQFKQQRVLKI